MIIESIALVSVTALAAAMSSALPDQAPRGERLTDAIDGLLPQTQCGQCGFPGCRPYAEAIAAGRAEINRCPPGGEPTLRQLALLLGRDVMSLDASLPPAVPGARALIDEDACIGCLKCVRACPVDAIVGAAGQMHTIIPQECTGCGLCLPPCPVDCIRLLAPADTVRNWTWPQPALSSRQT